MAEQGEGEGEAGEASAAAEAPKPDGDQELLDALRRGLSGSKPHVFEQLAGMSWAGVEAVEHAGHLLFPDKLLVVGKGGRVTSTSIRIRVPRGDELRAARVRARQMCKEDGVDPKLDPDLLEELENLCVLQVAVRAESPVFEPLHGDAREFERKYDQPVLKQLLQKVNAYVALVDPRPDQISADELVTLIAAVSKERSIHPLAAFGSGAQRSCVIFMADLLATSLGLRSSPAPSAPSTPAP